jgi:foldase protein PrsA
LSKPMQQNRLWMYSSIILAIVLIVYIVSFPPGNKSASDSATVAKVNGTIISKDKLYDTLVGSSGQQTLETMINNEIVRQAAEKQGIKVTDADIEKEMEEIKAGFSSDEEFQSTLAMYGMTLEGLRSDMTTQVQLRKLLEPQVTVTDEDIQAYYDENLASLKTPEQVQTSHILVATKAEAESILAELMGGAVFSTLAKEKSLDTATKESGGELEPFAKGDMDELTENAVFTLELGGISQVVEASDGFHIYTLTERRAEVTPTLEEKKADILETLTTEQLTTLSTNWMTEQQSTAEIETYLS